MRARRRVTVVAPTVVAPDAPTLTAPAEAADVYDGVGVTVSATVTAGQVPDRIDFVLDGATVVATDSASPYSQTWTPSGVSAGAHTLRARFVYGSGYVDSADTNIVLFDPTVISGLVLWLRADAGITLASGKVSAWNDQSGNGKHFTQATGDNQPVPATGINSRASVLFDGVDDHLFASGWPGAAAAYTQLITTHIVAIDSSASAGQEYKNDTLFAATSARQFITLKSDGTVYCGGYDGTFDVASAAITTGAGHVVETRHESGSMYVSVDGAGEGTVVSGDNTSVGDMRIGTAYDAAQGWLSAHVGDVLMYNVAVSSGNRTRLRAYLGARYGITVS